MVIGLVKVRLLVVRVSHELVKVKDKVLVGQSTVPGPLNQF